MGKFTAVEDAIFSVFATNAWQSEGVETIPANYVSPANPGGDFIRVNVISNGKGVNTVSVSGMLIVDIFTSAGQGPRPATVIADKLESYLRNQSIITSKGTTQFHGGAFTLKGLDTANPTLFRSSYSIPFHFYGVA